MSEKKLVKKLVEVMKQVKYIQKTGTNSFHNYKYATEADVNEKVREVLAEHNVIMIPNVKSHAYREHINAKGKTEYIVTVEVEFTFTDGDTGETISFTTFGEGQDAGDKGTYKAITGAQKYALMKAFMIPTGDDPEADGGVDERNNNNDNRQSNRRAESNDIVDAFERETAKNSDFPPASLKAKYKMGKKSLEGFDEWVADQKAKGRTYQQMEQILTEAMKKGAQQIA